MATDTDPAVQHLPPTLDAGRHLHLHGRDREPWIRRLVLLVLAVAVVLGLVGVFGQPERVSRAVVPQAELRVSAPDRVRGGVFYQGRFDITARQDVKHPTLVLGAGWTEQMQLNTIEPSPDAEGAPDGRLHLRYGELKGGETLTVWIQLEVNPVSSGRRDQSVELWDGTTVLAKVTRRVSVFF
jgi:hypothetical protein